VIAGASGTKRTKAAPPEFSVDPRSERPYTRLSRVDQYRVGSLRIKSGARLAMV